MAKKCYACDSSAVGFAKTEDGYGVLPACKRHSWPGLKSKCKYCSGPLRSGSWDDAHARCQRLVEMDIDPNASRRRNPSLIVLSNPERVPGEHVGRKTWGKFHLKGGEKAGIQKIPDVPGMPKTVVVLGALEQVVLGGDETVFGHTRRIEFDFDRSIKGGPWLVMDTAGKTLYVVAKTPRQISALMDVGTNANQGAGKVLSIAYWPGPNSGKHDQLAFSHSFGEGGKLPKKRWRETWPKLSPIGKRAFELIRPRKNGYTIEDRGIVG